jgi:hypothetical protein
MNRYDKTQLMRELQDLRNALASEANGPEAPPPPMHRDDARIFAQKLSGSTTDEQAVAAREDDPVGAYCFLRVAADLVEGSVSPKPSLDVHTEPDKMKYGALCAFVLQDLLRLERMKPDVYREAFR